MNPCPFCGRLATPLVLCEECERFAIHLRTKAGLPIRGAQKEEA